MDDFVIENGILLRCGDPSGEVRVPEGVVSIGENAFRECAALTAIILPEGLREIGRGAFYGCSRLARIALPGTLVSIRPWAFYRCGRLDELTLPDGLAEIGESAFRGCAALRSLTLPEGITEPGVSAFDGCTGLTEVILPSSLRCVSASLFRGCTSLERITLPEGVESIGRRAFWGCSQVRSVRMPAGLLTIGEDAFYYCSSLDGLVLPDGLSSVGRCAFYGCAALGELTFPDVPAEIGRFAFAKTRWWDAQPDGPVYLGRTLYQYKGQMPKNTPLSLAAGTKHIAEYAFCGCAGLTQVTVPEGVTAIGESAFEDCTELRAVSLPASLVSLGAGAFQGCTSLKAIALPEGLTEIGVRAFRRCSGLRRLRLPLMLRILGEGAFSRCEDLEEFTIHETAVYFSAPGGVVYSKNGKELLLYPEGRPERVYAVPEGTERIAPGAFDCVRMLKQLLLPRTAERLEPGTFTGAPLEYVRCSPRMRRLPAEVFAPETYVGIYYADQAEKVARPVYLGGGVDELTPKIRSAAVLGFLYAHGQGVEEISRWRSGYAAYIRRNEDAYSRMAAGNEPLLHLMLEERLLSERSVKLLLSGAIGQERTDLTAELLSYQETMFPRQNRDAFTLDDDPGGLEEAIRRRAQVSDQVGIEGLSFAVTGTLRRFGFYDHSGAADWSDLRAYIKKRGGTLQGEVTPRTDYLICSDPSLDSAKLRRAAEYGVPVITEQEFLRMASVVPRRNFYGV